jgi:hypothetical protein
LQRDVGIIFLLSFYSLARNFDAARIFCKSPLNLPAGSADTFLAGGTEVPMKRLMISTFAAVALLAAATTMLWSNSPSNHRPPVGPAGMMSLQDLYAAAGVNKLPIEEFEDQSLVYSTVTKR